MGSQPASWNQPFLEEASVKKSLATGVKIRGTSKAAWRPVHINQ